MRPIEQFMPYQAYRAFEKTYRTALPGVSRHRAARLFFANLQAYSNGTISEELAVEQAKRQTISDLREWRAGRSILSAQGSDRK